MTKICRITVLLLAFCFSLGARAENHTQIRLLLSSETVRPGDTIWAGLQMDISPGWHVYWRNSGDSGIPTEIKWTLPDGITAGQIQWSVPVKETDADPAGDISLITYVYKNQCVLLVPLTIDKGAKPGAVTITASAKWMECSDICVFANSDAGATLTIGDEAKPSADAAMLDKWRGRVPQTDSGSTASAYWDSAPAKDNARNVVIIWKTNAAPADFYPFANTNFDVGGATETLPSTDGAIHLRKSVKKSGSDWPKQLDGILAGKAGSPDAFGLEEHLKIQATAPAGAAPESKPPAQTASIVTMLVLAFLGGLILNVMPCVLPVIALKILGFVNQSTEEPRRVKQLGTVYGLGVLASFLVLAGLAIGVQRAGGVANWGDAFHNQHFQIVMTVLMTLIALNLFGVFEITLSGKALGAASELSGRPGFSGAFFNGMLATALATPCTAPLLSTAIGFALTQSALTIVLFFLMAGLGLAFPFVAICWNPRLLKLVPKPGAWMEKFKNALGFPMLATAVWLTWVSSQTEDDPLWIGLFLVVVAVAAWVWGQFVQRGARGKSLAIVICLGLLVADYSVILKGKIHHKDSIDWKVWSPAAVEAARRAGHPVFVDFTAKSCITCNLNLASSIEIDRTRAKLKDIGAVTFKADDTLDDPVIDQELRRYNTSGVPLVLVYAKDLDQAPQVLPAILTPAIVLAALDKAAK